eukprot:g14089.t1
MAQSMDIRGKKVNLRSLDLEDDRIFRTSRNRANILNKKKQKQKLMYRNLPSPTSTVLLLQSAEQADLSAGLLRTKNEKLAIRKKLLAEKTRERREQLEAMSYNLHNDVRRQFVPFRGWNQNSHHSPDDHDDDASSGTDTEGRTVSPEDAVKNYDRLVEWHGKRWKGTGQPVSHRVRPMKDAVADIFRLYEQQRIAPTAPAGASQDSNFRTTRSGLMFEELPRLYLLLAVDHYAFFRWAVREDWINLNTPLVPRDLYEYYEDTPGTGNGPNAEGTETHDLGGERANDEEECECPICLEPINIEGKKAFVLACGHRFCHRCVFTNCVRACALDADGGIWEVKEARSSSSASSAEETGKAGSVPFQSGKQKLLLERIGEGDEFHSLENNIKAEGKCGTHLHCSFSCTEFGDRKEMLTRCTPIERWDSVARKKVCLCCSKIGKHQAKSYQSKGQELRAGRSRHGRGGCSGDASESNCTLLMPNFKAGMPSKRGNSLVVPGTTVGDALVSLAAAAGAVTTLQAVLHWWTHWAAGRNTVHPCDRGQFSHFQCAFGPDGVRHYLALQSSWQALSRAPNLKMVIDDDRFIHVCVGTVPLQNVFLRRRKKKIMFKDFAGRKKQLLTEQETELGRLETALEYLALPSGANGSAAVGEQGPGCREELELFRQAADFIRYILFTPGFEMLFQRLFLKKTKVFREFCSKVSLVLTFDFLRQLRHAWIGSGGVGNEGVRSLTPENARFLQQLELAGDVENRRRCFVAASANSAARRRARDRSVSQQQCGDRGSGCASSCGSLLGFALTGSAANGEFEEEYLAQASEEEAEENAADLVVLGPHALYHLEALQIAKVDLDAVSAAPPVGQTVDEWKKCCENSCIEKNIEQLQSVSLIDSYVRTRRKRVSYLGLALRSRRFDQAELFFEIERIQDDKCAPQTVAEQRRATAAKKGNLARQEQQRDRNRDTNASPAARRAERTWYERVVDQYIRCELEDDGALLALPPAAGETIYGDEGNRLEQVRSELDWIAAYLATHVQISNASFRPSTTDDRQEASASACRPRPYCLWTDYCVQMSTKKENMKPWGGTNDTQEPLFLYLWRRVCFIEAEFGEAYFPHLCNLRVELEIAPPPRGNGDTETTRDSDSDGESAEDVTEDGSGSPPYYADMDVLLWKPSTHERRHYADRERFALTKKAVFLLSTLRKQVQHLRVGKECDVQKILPAEARPRSARIPGQNQDLHDISRKPPSSPGRAGGRQEDEHEVEKNRRLSDMLQREVSRLMNENRDLEKTCATNMFALMQFVGQRLIMWGTGSTALLKPAAAKATLLSSAPATAPPAEAGTVFEEPGMCAASTMTSAVAPGTEERNTTRIAKEACCNRNKWSLLLIGRQKMIDLREDAEGAKVIEERAGQPLLQQLLDLRDSGSARRGRQSCRCTGLPAPLILRLIALLADLFSMKLEQADASATDGGGGVAGSCRETIDDRFLDLILRRPLMELDLATSGADGSAAAFPPEDPAQPSWRRNLPTDVVGVAGKDKRAVPSIAAESGVPAHVHHAKLTKLLLRSEAGDPFGRRQKFVLRERMSGRELGDIGTTRYRSRFLHYWTGPNAVLPGSRFSLDKLSEYFYAYNTAPGEGADVNAAARGRASPQDEDEDLLEPTSNTGWMSPAFVIRYLALEHGLDLQHTDLDQLAGGADFLLGEGIAGVMGGEDGQIKYDASPFEGVMSRRNFEAVRVESPSKNSIYDEAIAGLGRIEPSSEQETNGSPPGPAARGPALAFAEASPLCPAAAEKGCFDEKYTCERCCRNIAVPIGDLACWEGEMKFATCCGVTNYRLALFSEAQQRNDPLATDKNHGSYDQVCPPTALEQCFDCSSAVGGQTCEHSAPPPALWKRSTRDRRYYADRERFALTKKAELLLTTLRKPVQHLRVCPPTALEQCFDAHFPCEHCCDTKYGPHGNPYCWPAVPGLERDLNYGLCCGVQAPFDETVEKNRTSFVGMLDWEQDVRNVTSGGGEDGREAGKDNDARSTEEL